MQPLAPAPPHSAQQEMHADNDLRAQLAAVINTPPNQQQQQQLQQAQQQQQSHLPHLQPLQPMGQQQHMPHAYDSAPNSANTQNIDPAIAGQAHAHHALDMMGGGSAGGDSGDDNTDGRKGAKRELSQSKRAAQNRAAQRAFRQRKEGYIKQLESKVRDLNTLDENFKLVQSENYALRDYILQLQRRLLESQNEYPQPPPLINAIMNQQHPAHDAQRQQSSMGQAGMGQQQQQGAMSMAPTAAMGQVGQPAMGQDQTRQMQEQMSPQLSGPMHDLQARAAAAVVDFKESVEKRRQEHEDYLGRHSQYKQNEPGGGGEEYKQGGVGDAYNKEERNPEEELTRQLQSASQDEGGLQGLQGM